MRSMVVGAFRDSLDRTAAGPRGAPSTALRAVPLPRVAGEDEQDALGRARIHHRPQSIQPIRLRNMLSFGVGCHFRFFEPP